MQNESEESINTDFKNVKVKISKSNPPHYLDENHIFDSNLRIKLLQDYLITHKSYKDYIVSVELINDIPKFTCLCGRIWHSDEFVWINEHKHKQCKQHQEFLKNNNIDD